MDHWRQSMSRKQQARWTRALRSAHRRAGRALIAIAAIGAVVVAISARFPAVAARSQSTRSVDPIALSAFVDSFMTARMASDRIPGGGFVFVQNSRVLVTRGYGLANVAHQRRVLPESTIWRIGSISKAFTATAVM